MMQNLFCNLQILCEIKQKIKKQYKKYIQYKNIISFL